MQTLFDAVYNGEKWTGKNADIFAVLAGMTRLPWPFRMSVRPFGGAITLTPAQPSLIGSDGHFWIPSVQTYHILPELGMRCVGEIFTKPSTEPMSVDIIRRQIAECERETAAIFERGSFKTS